MSSLALRTSPTFLSQSWLLKSTLLPPLLASLAWGLGILGFFLSPRW
jgi:hypothetical protein